MTVSSSTGARSSPTGATCWRATGSSTWPGRWLVWAASGPGAGSRCCSARTTTTRSCSRSRRPPSVLEPYAGKSGYATRSAGRGRAAAPPGDERHPAVLGQHDGSRWRSARLLRPPTLGDWKISADVDTITPEGMKVYSEICGWTLARGHARSGDRAGDQRVSRCQVACSTKPSPTSRPLTQTRTSATTTRHGTGCTSLAPEAVGAEGSNPTSSLVRQNSRRTNAFKGSPGAKRRELSGLESRGHSRRLVVAIAVFTRARTGPRRRLRRTRRRPRQATTTSTTTTTGPAFLSTPGVICPESLSYRLFERCPRRSCATHD